MSQYADIDGVRLHYLDSGETHLPAIVIMHGWGCNVSTVASITALFAGKMRTITIDLPGHGQSSEPPAVWGVEDFTRCIEHFLSHLGVSRPSLLGHSFGGRIAILFASRNEADKVVLLDAAGIKPRRSLGYWLKVYRFKLAKRLQLALLGRERGGRAVERLRGKAGSADYRNSSPMMRAVMSKCVNEDLKSVMPLIKAPTLLVWGENDTATPMSDAKTMERLIPDAGLVAFPGAGHYSFLDNPIGFRAVIRNFFNL